MQKSEDKVCYPWLRNKVNRKDKNAKERCLVQKFKEIGDNVNRENIGKE